MQVVLSPELEALVRRKVESGQYASSDQVISDALRLLLDRDETHGADVERLRAALVAGERSPLADDYDIERIIAELDDAPSSSR